MRAIFHKILFVLNVLVALTLFLSYLLPYVSPISFPLISILSLAVPVLIVVNIIFLLYWIVILNKKFLVSLIVLLLGFSHVTSLYRFNFLNDEQKESSDTLKLMTYNVLSFNKFSWLKSPTIPSDISDLVRKQNPDIVCMQEFNEGVKTDFSQYPYKFLKYNHKKRQLALTIFSKFPIINKGSFDFKKTANNIIYADIVQKEDTLRIYNLHLQSHRITSEINHLNQINSKTVVKNIRHSFKKQQKQTEQLIKHMKASPYKNIVMGDFNNTAYSYIYNQIISEGLIDTFKEAGEGFGKTFKFDLFPARIDFILAPDDSKVKAFHTLNKHYSDHFPIYAEITIP